MDNLEKALSVLAIALECVRLALMVANLLQA